MALALSSCHPRTDVSDPDLLADAIPSDVVWLDMLDPTPDEIAFVERTTGLHVPSRDELGEIETSSRLRTENGALYLSMSMLYGVATNEPQVTPLGFVLTKDWLITVRFEPITVFDVFKGHVGKPDVIHPSSTGAFVGLLEAMVDRFADHLERAGAELDAASHQIFRAPPNRSMRRAVAERSLRDTIRGIGREGDFISKIRDSLVGVGRIVPFASSRGMGWMPAEAHERLTTLRLDIQSLNDHDAYLNGKVQFLLDATLGLVNIEQNDIIKVLAIVSIVGIGPTLVASWYGMNFRIIPELQWRFGYLYAIGLALLTGLAPLLWFRLRRWF